MNFRKAMGRKEEILALSIVIEQIIKKAKTTSNMYQSQFLWIYIYRYTYIKKHPKNANWLEMLRILRISGMDYIIEKKIIYKVN